MMSLRLTVLTHGEGLTIQPLRMYSTNGYTCFLLREDPLRIPSNERRIRDVRKLLKSLWLVKVGFLKSAAGERLTGI